MKTRNVVIFGFALAAVIAALIVFYVRNEPADDAHVPAAVTPSRPAPDPRGPRPAATRLRDGARQIEDKSQALASVEKSLARIEHEIASTSDAEKRKLLEHQKKLAEEAIARLKK